jgi:mutator protein MutT
VPYYHKRPVASAAALKFSSISVRIGANHSLMLRVTAAVIEREGKVLLARRSRSGSAGGRWEFPGGTIEPGETPEQCLARELREELGIDSRVGEFLASSRVASGTAGLELLAYRVVSFTGELRANVHEEVRWVAPGELALFDLAEADRLLLPLVFGGQTERATGER